MPTIISRSRPSASSACFLERRNLLAHLLRLLDLLVRVFLLLLPPRDLFRDLVALRLQRLHLGDCRLARLVDLRETPSTSRSGFFPRARSIASTLSRCSRTNARSSIDKCSRRRTTPRARKYNPLMLPETNDFRQQWLQLRFFCSSVPPFFGSSVRRLLVNYSLPCIPAPIASSYWFSLSYSPAGQALASAYNAHPKLVVLIVVDQLRGDLLERYHDQFVEGGFRLLMDKGAYFSNCNYQYANTRTAPGHATIGTGTYTLRSRHHRQRILGRRPEEEVRHHIRHHHPPDRRRSRSTRLITSRSAGYYLFR